MLLPGSFVLLVLVIVAAQRAFMGASLVFSDTRRRFGHPFGIAAGPADPVAEARGRIIETDPAVRAGMKDYREKDAVAPGRHGPATLRIVVLVLLAVPAVALLASETPWWEHRVEPTYRLLADPDPRVLYEAPGVAGSRVALTIDDGPDARTTPRILEVLERHGATATFFLTAGRVPGNGQVVERIIAEGHEIGNHMMADRPSIDLRARGLERRLQEAEDILSRWQAPRWFRPASGWYDETMLRVAERHGYRTALGRVYPFDAMLEAPGLAARLIRWRAEPGEIIILHDAGSRGRATARTLEHVLPALEERGLNVVTLSELVTPRRRSAGGPQGEIFHGSPGSN